MIHSHYEGTPFITCILDEDMAMAVNELNDLDRMTANG